jgi:predicted ArsR family transcriptional regulator
MKSTRERIIDYLFEHRVATAPELSRALSLTAADVRHHLSQLVKHGTLANPGYRFTQLKGRPARLYALSKPLSRNNLDLLAHHLLAKLSELNPPEGLNSLLKDIANRFAADVHGESSNITYRIYQTIIFLQHLNYDATWEARARSPLLIFGHCPFAAILDRHPEICLMDKYLLETLLGKPVHQTEKLTISSQGLPRCIFSLAG